MKKMPHAKVVVPPSRGGEGTGVESAPQKVTSRKTPGSPESSRRHKKAKIVTWKMCMSSTTHECGVPSSSKVAPPGEGSEGAREKGVIGSSGSDPSRKAVVCPKSMEELCRVLSLRKGEQFQALKMVDLPTGE